MGCKTKVSKNHWFSILKCIIKSQIKILWSFDSKTLYIFADFVFDLKQNPNTKWKQIEMFKIIKEIKIWKEYNNFKLRYYNLKNVYHHTWWLRGFLLKLNIVYHSKLIFKSNQPIKKYILFLKSVQKTYIVLITLNFYHIFRKTR